MLRILHSNNKGRRQMKKIMITMLTSFILLAGCQSNDTKASEPKQAHPQHKIAIVTKSVQSFPYPNLLAQDERTYSLLVIGETEEQTPIEKNQKVTEHVKNILSLPSQELAQKAYPELEISKTIAYILFNHTGIVHQAKNLPELISFLQKNPPAN
ncbi:hypothetical protein L1999_11380 [Neobacillus drentensis]|uniref:hypothetical protein n=1 Tax=Neobacillus drentensis TaxID=220684 RepID=UPI001F200D56|nr:hypothetical protein [Neobacillus drentensis]ULT59084.1 hypothetical protein L1999_11380 [Neobacillus drentensis]